MVFVLVLIWPIVKRLTRNQLTWIFLIISIACEVLFSVIHLSDNIYRLLSVRYLFIIPLALSWVNEGVVLTKSNTILSIISIVAVLFFSMSSLNLEPFFFQTGWATHRWICYFYLPTILTYLLWILSLKICRFEYFYSFIKMIGKSSYEIYLLQMFVFVLFPADGMEYISTSLVRIPLRVILTFSISIIGGIILNKYIQKKTVVHK